MLTFGHLDHLGGTPPIFRHTDTKSHDGSSIAERPLASAEQVAPLAMLPRKIHQGEVLGELGLKPPTIWRFFNHQNDISILYKYINNIYQYIVHICKYTYKGMYIIIINNAIIVSILPII